jgi:beta-xylosidase
VTVLRNPLVSGVNPDPSVTRADGAYYLVTSTFEYLPGIPVYRSDDFATWEHIGNVVTSVGPGWPRGRADGRGRVGADDPLAVGELDEVGVPGVLDRP